MTKRDEFYPLPELRWFAFRQQDHNPTLQQAWAPKYGGQIEWLDVPLVYGTDEPATAGVPAAPAPEYRDACTDPDNCRRCGHATPTWDQVNHSHAGIPVGPQKAKPASGVATGREGQR